MKNTNTELIEVLHARFEKNMNRHKNLKWEDVLKKLESNKSKLEVLAKMEETGGEPDIVDYDIKSHEFVFYDCSPESPIGRRNVCYDKLGQDSRSTDSRPKNNAVDMAKEIGIEILTENEYRKLQDVGNFDTKTSSWLKTPKEIRDLGGAIFADYRYGQVFVYHNSAPTYYQARGFRGFVRV